MELTQLQYFMAVADSLHFTRTAEILHVSQSALSMSILRLEKELGVRLFERKGRTIQLTYAGKQFAEKIAPALAQIENARIELMSMSDEVQSYLEISVEVIDFASELLMNYLNEFPAVRFHQTFDTRTTAEERLLCGKADFSFSYEPFSAPEIRSVQLQNDPIFLLVHKDHPFAKREFIYIEEIRDQAIISMGPAYGYRQWTDRMCFHAGFRPNIYYEVCDLQSITRTVEHGQAIGFISRSTWEQNELLASSNESKYSSIRAIPIQNGHCRRPVYLCWNQTHKITGSKLHFIEYTAQVMHISFDLT